MKHNIDWGHTSLDYVKYRPGPPESFYKKLSALDIGLKNQKILDLGTVTGVLARKFASQGAHVTGIDISSAQIEQAKQLAIKENLSIDFRVSSTESTPFQNHSFEVATANQCWRYFELEKAIAEMRRVLMPEGMLVVSFFSWLPKHSAIAAASEALILKHERWKPNEYRNYMPALPQWAEKDFNLKGMFFYDEEISFTRETWRGRIRANRGVGASLSEEEVIQFDQEHAELLSRIAPEQFTIPHRLGAHILRFKT